MILMMCVCVVLDRFGWFFSVWEMVLIEIFVVCVIL